MADTIFGKIARGEAQADLVYEDNRALAFRDVNPQAPVHILVIPRKPIARLCLAEEGDEELLGHLLSVAARVASELPFMATENILMATVAAGGDRQDLHEKIRTHSQAAARQVKAEGKPNDLIDRLKADQAFAEVDVDAALDPPAFIGRAPEQVDEFIATHVEPVREQYAHLLGQQAELEHGSLHGERL